MEATAVVQVLARIDSWLDTMRGTDGYGGPVAHWWQNCLQFTGAGLDWRYEGLITGYLTLHERTGQSEWLAKARRAGDDLLSGQLPGGTYRNSSFELNPYSGGTPHEAAVDLALLHLAEALRERGDHGPAAAGRTPSTAASPAAVPSGRDGRRVPSWRDGVPIRQPTGRTPSTAASPAAAGRKVSPCAGRGTPSTAASPADAESVNRTSRIKLPRSHRCKDVS